MPPPLVAAVFFAPVRTLLDSLAALSRRLPRWSGVVLLLGCSAARRLVDLVRIVRVDRSLT